MDPVAQRIRSQTIELAARWEARARELPELQHMSQPVLFDHLFELLEGLAAWIDGKPEIARRAFDALLDGHALQRLGHGVSLRTLITEYSELRSILMIDLLALETSDQVRGSTVRLHHGFDQAIGAALHRYEQAREQQRERFIAVLGHDLRQPLGAIAMTANVLAEPRATTDVAGATAVILRSCTRMTRLIDDMLDFARGRLGAGIPVVPALHDMAEICRTVAEEVTAAHPGHPIELDLRGDLRGPFDRDRMLQALGNLLINGIEHGRGPLTLRAGEADDSRAVVVEVISHGPAIRDDVLRQIFDPFATTSPRRGLGLGMYIVQQVARAHGGLCEASSDDRATTFRMQLPRAPERERLARAVP